VAAAVIVGISLIVVIITIRAVWRALKKLFSLSEPETKSAV